MSDISISLLGAFIGFVAGLIPGIHINNFILFLMKFKGYYNNLQFLLIVISSSIAYSFSDVIPSTFLGIPDESMAVSVYPAHEMVLEGDGIEAIALATFSGLFSILFLSSIFILFANFNIYNKLKFLTPLVLILILLVLLFQEKGDLFAGKYSKIVQRTKALFLIVVSGFLGFLAFRYNPPKFTPLFSGLFAFPVILQGIRRKSEIPKQKLKFRPKLLPSISGSIGGVFTSIFPGISSGIASTMAVIPFKEKDARSYVSATGAANTANALMCFAVLMSSGVGRSGASSAIKDFMPVLNPFDVLILCIFSALFSAILTLISAIFIGKLIPKINTKLLCYFALFIVLITVLIDGLSSILLFIISSLVGLIPEKLKVKRINCMGSLIVPLIFFHTIQTL